MTKEQKMEALGHREVQRHGFVFEDWVRATFFNDYLTMYTNEWDVSAEANENFGRIPVSIKTAKYGSPIYLGDALRQFQIVSPFLLIVGFWNQSGTHKKFVNVVAITVTPEQWRALWQPISLADVRMLDNAIKNRETSYQQARVQAQKIKNSSPFHDAIITMNPKIDSRNQRRLQCSLRFNAVFDSLAPEAKREAAEQPQLFETPVLEAFISAPRVFRRTTL